MTVCTILHKDNPKITNLAVRLYCIRVSTYWMLKSNFNMCFQLFFYILCVCMCVHAHSGAPAVRDARDRCAGLVQEHRVHQWLRPPGASHPGGFFLQPDRLNPFLDYKLFNSALQTSYDSVIYQLSCPNLCHRFFSYGIYKLVLKKFQESNLYRTM